MSDPCNDYRPPRRILKTFSGTIRRGTFILTTTITCLPNGTIGASHSLQPVGSRSRLEWAIARAELPRWTTILIGMYENSLRRRGVRANCQSYDNKFMQKHGISTRDLRGKSLAEYLKTHCRNKNRIKSKKIRLRVIDPLKRIIDEELKRPLNRSGSVHIPDIDWWLDNEQPDYTGIDIKPKKKQTEQDDQVIPPPPGYEPIPYKEENDDAQPCDLNSKDDRDRDGCKVVNCDEDGPDGTTHCMSHNSSKQCVECDDASWDNDSYPTPPWMDDDSSMSEEDASRAWEQLLMEQDMAKRKTGPSSPGPTGIPDDFLDKKWGPLIRPTGAGVSAGIMGQIMKPLERFGYSDLYQGKGVEEAIPAGPGPRPTGEGEDDTSNIHPRNYNPYGPRANVSSMLLPDD